MRISASAHRHLQRNIEVHDLQLVRDEGTAGLAILATPFEIGESDAVALLQTCTTIGERINDRR